MDRKSLESPHGVQPPAPDDEEDAETWFRHYVEVIVADDEGGAEFLIDAQVDAHWSRRLAALAERAEQLRRAA